MDAEIDGLDGRVPFKPKKAAEWILCPFVFCVDDHLERHGACLAFLGAYRLADAHDGGGAEQLVFAVGAHHGERERACAGLRVGDARQREDVELLARHRDRERYRGEMVLEEAAFDVAVLAFNERPGFAVRGHGGVAVEVGNGRAVEVDGEVLVVPCLCRRHTSFLPISGDYLEFYGLDRVDGFLDGERGLHVRQVALRLVRSRDVRVLRDAHVEGVREHVAVVVVLRRREDIGDGGGYRGNSGVVEVHAVSVVRAAEQVEDGFLRAEAEPVLLHDGIDVGRAIADRAEVGTFHAGDLDVNIESLVARPDEFRLASRVRNDGCEVLVSPCAAGRVVAAAVRHERRREALSGGFVVEVDGDSRRCLGKPVDGSSRRTSPRGLRVRSPLR